MRNVVALGIFGRKSLLYFMCLSLPYITLTIAAVSPSIPPTNFLDHVPSSKPGWNRTDITYPSGSRQKGKIFRRTRRTLLLLREIDPRKGGKLGDICNYESWMNEILPVYLKGIEEGRRGNKDGIKLAQERMNRFQDYIDAQNVPPEGIYKTWGSKYCIGEFPMECSKSSQTCKCLKLQDYPNDYYNFKNEFAGAGRCNVLKNSYCNEKVNMFCEHRLVCRQGACVEEPVSYNGEGALRFELGVGVVAGTLLVLMLFT